MKLNFSAKNGELRLSELSGFTHETFHLYLVLTRNAFICTNEPYSLKYNKTFLALPLIFYSKSLFCLLIVHPELMLI